MKHSICSLEMFFFAAFVYKWSNLRVRLATQCKSTTQVQFVATCDYSRVYFAKALDKQFGFEEQTGRGNALYFFRPTRFTLTMLCVTQEFPCMPSREATNTRVWPRLEGSKQNKLRVKRPRANGMEVFFLTFSSPHPHRLTGSQST